MDNASKKQKLNDDEQSMASASSSSGHSSQIMNIIDLSNPSTVSNIINTMTASETIEHNERIRRWQERQLSRCIDENTINRVIELYLRVVNEVNSLIEPINIPQLLQSNEVANVAAPNNGLEESAILMAISEHGLQQGVGSTAGNVNVSQIEIDNEIIINQPLSPESSENVDSNEDNDDFEVEETPLNSPGAIAVPNENEEQIDFIEAAVAVAIQKKGLTPFAISMSPTR